MMSDLISRKALLENLIGFEYSNDVENIFDLITNAPAIEQGEVVKPQFSTMLRKMWSGGEVQEWIDENWTSSYTTQEQPKPLFVGIDYSKDYVAEKVSDALEEEAKLCDELAEQDYCVDVRVASEAIRALIKRNAKEGE